MSWDQGTCPNIGPHQFSHGAKKALSILPELLISGPATTAAVLEKIDNTLHMASISQGSSFSFSHALLIIYAMKS